MFCEKCGREIGEDMQCGCEKQNKAGSHLSASESAYLPWVFILASVWCVVVGEVFILKEVTGFVLLGLVKWLLGGGWISLLIYLGFIALCAYLELMCEDVGFKNIIFTHMDGNKRAAIAKVSKGCIHVFDLFIGLQMIIGVVGFYRDTGTLLNRGILLETHMFNVLQLSVFYMFLSIVPDIFSGGENGKEKLGQ